MPIRMFQSFLSQFDFSEKNIIDLTNATSDYFLKRGEVALIQAHNVTSKPLRIATQDGTAYNMWVIPYNTGGTSGASSGDILLTPNNTTYSNAFVGAVVYRHSDTSGSIYNTYSAFYIGRNFAYIVCCISNFTVHKSIIGHFNFYGNTYGYPSSDAFGSTWRDTTTAWTSLGTIVWPQSSRAYILVQRIL